MTTFKFRASIRVSEMLAISVEANVRTANVMPELKQAADCWFAYTENVAASIIGSGGTGA